MEPFRNLLNLQEPFRNLPNGSFCRFILELSVGSYWNLLWVPAQHRLTLASVVTSYVAVVSLCPLVAVVTASDVRCRFNVICDLCPQLRRDRPGVLRSPLRPGLLHPLHRHPQLVQMHQTQVGNWFLPRLVKAH